MLDIGFVKNDLDCCNLLKKEHVVFYIDQRFVVVESPNNVHWSVHCRLSNYFDAMKTCVLAELIVDHWLGDNNTDTDLEELKSGLLVDLIR